MTYFNTYLGAAGALAVDALRGPAGGRGFRAWLVAVMLMNTLSLIIDAIDVVRYARGERTPTITLPE